MDCLIVGDSWKGPWLARELSSRGAKVHYLRIGGPPSSRLCAVYVGNGEQRARCELTFGAEATSVLWEASEKNYRRIDGFLQQARIPVRREQAHWFENGAENSPALVFESEALTRFLTAELSREGIAIEDIDGIKSLSRLDTFQYEVVAGEKKFSAAAVFITCENFPRHLIAGLGEIWLGMTLNRFEFPTTQNLSAVSLFHGGVDYAWQMEPGRVVLGSFRNLFEDRAFGLRPDWIDAVSEKSVAAFFQKQGWISTPKPESREIVFESLSCDGLPLAGALPAYPGVFLLSAFGGRTPHFFFEVARCLAEAFTRGGVAPILSFTTPKRLA